MPCTSYNGLTSTKFASQLVSYTVMKDENGEWVEVPGTRQAAAPKMKVGNWVPVDEKELALLKVRALIMKWRSSKSIWTAFATQHGWQHIYTHRPMVFVAIPSNTAPPSFFCSLQIKEDGKIDVDELAEKLPMKGTAPSPFIGKDGPTDIKDGIIEVDCTRT